MLTIGTVAKRTGLRASAIRYYERRGLIEPARLLNGYRVYDREALAELRFLRQAQSLGFTLTELKPLLVLARDGRRPCEGVRKLARRHMVEIDGKMRQLRFLRKELKSLLSRRVADGSDEICPLMPSATNRLRV